MIHLELCGINNGTQVPFLVSSNGQISTSTASSSNNGDNSSADLKGVLLGKYNNTLVPVLVDNNGRLIL